jgi:4-oxalocrotonate tautomerase
MPYIAIKSFPKDQETKKRVVEKINKMFLEEWGCPPQAITISIEEIAPDEWEEKIVKSEIEPKKKNMMILSGEKCY